MAPHSNDLKIQNKLFIKEIKINFQLDKKNQVKSMYHVAKKNLNLFSQMNTH